MEKKKPEIKLDKCESSNIASYGYCDKTNTLAVKYKSGGIYHYPNYDAKQFEELKSAKSIGKHINSSIKGLKFDKIK